MKLVKSDSLIELGAQLCRTMAVRPQMDITSPDDVQFLHDAKAWALATMSLDPEGCALSARSGRPHTAIYNPAKITLKLPEGHKESKMQTLTDLFHEAAHHKQLILKGSKKFFNKYRNSEGDISTPLWSADLYEWNADNISAQLLSELLSQSAPHLSQVQNSALTFVYKQEIASCQREDYKDHFFYTLVKPLYLLNESLDKTKLGTVLKAAAIKIKQMMKVDVLRLYSKALDAFIKDGYIHDRYTFNQKLDRLIEYSCYCDDKTKQNILKITSNYQDILEKSRASGGMPTSKPVSHTFDCHIEYVRKVATGIMTVLGTIPEFMKITLKTINEKTVVLGDLSQSLNNSDLHISNRYNKQLNSFEKICIEDKPYKVYLPFSECEKVYNNLCAKYAANPNVSER